MTARGPDFIWVWVRRSKSRRVGVGAQVNLSRGRDMGGMGSMDLLGGIEDKSGSLAGDARHAGVGITTLLAQRRTLVLAAIFIRTVAGCATGVLRQIVFLPCS